MPRNREEADLFFCSVTPLQNVRNENSGNLDFMDESNSLLVGYDLTEIETTAGPYEKGNRWAEPSIPEAANAMRWVFNHPEEARLLGERARLTTNHYFSPQLCGSRMLDRLNQVRGERSKT